MGLSNYQLALLDNLIYLDSFKKYAVGLSYENGNIINDEITIGTAVKDIIHRTEGT